MTTTTPRHGPPRAHQGARPRGHNCARQSHIPQRTRRPVQRGQSSGPTRRTYHGEMRPNAMVWQEQALKTHAVCPNLTPVLTRTGHQYRTTWVKGFPYPTNVKSKCTSTTTSGWKAA